MRFETNRHLYRNETEFKSYQYQQVFELLNSSPKRHFDQTMDGKSANVSPFRTGIRCTFGRYRRFPRATPDRRETGNLTVRHGKRKFRFLYVRTQLSDTFRFGGVRVSTDRWFALFKRRANRSSHASSHVSRTL